MSIKSPLIAPSLLSANFGNMMEAVQRVRQAHADWIHLDIMDGSFVPNISFGPKMVKDLRPLSRMPFDVHLMIVHPENYIDIFCEAGADIITVHYEAVIHHHRLLSAIKDMNKKAGITIVPSTPVAVLEEILPFVDLVLVMSVNPGFGGQDFIVESLRKIEQLRDIKVKKGYRFLIEVDGGINLDNYSQVLKAGAEVLVMGSAFFRMEDPASAIEIIKGGKKKPCRDL